ncbi:prepilin-type N-terminal cleavage/methylation domain-containing protein, partial [Gluconobacter cerinus]|uniref:prepilin-type N-terminal cleavage/methylation domain-containing protein n=1 Tax=Gluconobacter cerinus TaxID=38307 RepID=UPI001B8B2DD7
MRRAGTAGFTLLEMLVVIVIAGLLASLIVSRGPLRSRALAFAIWILTSSGALHSTLTAPSGMGRVWR